MWTDKLPGYKDILTPADRYSYRAGGQMKEVGFIVTYVVFENGRLLTKTRFIESDMKSAIEMYMKSHQIAEGGMPIFKEGEFEKFLEDYIVMTAIMKSRPKNKIITTVKNILQEITNGRIVVRGRENAKR